MVCCRTQARGLLQERPLFASRLALMLLGEDVSVNGEQLAFAHLRGVTTACEETRGRSTAVRQVIDHIFLSAIDVDVLDDCKLRWKPR